MITNRALLSVLVMTTFLSGCASGQITRNFDKRADLVVAKIDQAVILGAKDYTPRELALARVALERALHDASKYYMPLSWINAEFDQAETAANKLLTRRSIAATP